MTMQAPDRPMRDVDVLMNMFCIGFAYDPEDLFIYLPDPDIETFMARFARMEKRGFVHKVGLRGYMVTPAGAWYSKVMQRFDAAHGIEPILLSY